MKWLFTLVFLTLLFIISSFFIDRNLVFAYRWMTIGISLVSFIFYYIVTTSNTKDNNKIIGGNLAAIVVKFILSLLVIIIYALVFGMKNKLEFVYFFIAYCIFSIVNYFFSYNYKKNKF